MAKIYLIRRPNGKCYMPMLRDAAPYAYIDPVDPVAFPVLTGLKVITLDGTENWSETGGGVYTSTYGDIIKNQARADVRGYCAEATFYPEISGLSSLPQDGFMFNGKTSTTLNGNLSFKNANTTSAAAWKAYLQEHPVTILISTNNPDTSVWKPAKRMSDGVTGYWDGSNGFVAVYGGIPYLGENLLTEEIIQNFYYAWISSAYSWASINDSATVKIPVEEGKYYRLSWDDSETTGTIFRYGFCAIASVPSTTLSAPRARTTPTDTPSVDVLASNTGLVVQATRVVGADPDSIRFRQLSVREMIGYAAPALTMGGNPNTEPETTD